ncbi:MAG: hypothetical protein GTO67_06500, partial [Gammaproteobacteria bacterium]|nr:hypothetical protein [Gammaproteobacteria bacterium]NIT16061.1 hypothetical protein [Gammaproteobacteria bacterium]
KRLRRVKPNGRAYREAQWEIAFTRVRIARQLRGLRLVPQQVEKLARTIVEADNKIKRHERSMRELSVRMRNFRDAHLK